MDTSASKCSEMELLHCLCFPVCVRVFAKEKFNRNYCALLQKLPWSFSRLSSKNSSCEANTWSMHRDSGQQVESPWGCSKLQQPMQRWVWSMSPHREWCLEDVSSAAPSENEKAWQQERAMERRLQGEKHVTQTEVGVLSINQIY